MDCGGGYEDEDCITQCTGTDSNGNGGQCEEIRDEEGNCIACPWMILCFLSAFLLAGVCLASWGVVSNKLTGDHFKLHQAQGDTSRGP